MLSEFRLVALQAPVYVVLAQVQRVPGVAANIALLAFILLLHVEFPSFERWAALCAFSLDVKKLIVIDHAQILGFGWPWHAIFLFFFGKLAIPLSITA